MIRKKRPTRPRKVRKVYPRVRPLGAPGGVFLPDHEQLVKLIAMRGATDEEIEAVYGLGKGTIKKWRKFYPGLNKAIEKGRTSADAQVLHALFKTAIGYKYKEEQAVGGKFPQVLEVKRYFPGQFLAQKHWLASRNREEWPASERIEMTGRNGEGIKIESRNDVIDAIMTLVSSKVDPEHKAKKEDRAS